jgi:hypothetical protein
MRSGFPVGITHYGGNRLLDGSWTACVTAIAVFSLSSKAVFFRQCLSLTAFGLPLA